MTTTRPQTEVYGKGIERPLRVLSTGALAVTEGEQRLWESVQEIIDTPQGSRPMQPTFGIPLDIYDSVTDVRAVAWGVGRAIERHEPRAKDINVGIRKVDDQGTVWLEIGIVPRGTSTQLNKIFPVYRKA